MLPACLVKTEAVVAEEAAEEVKTEDYVPEGYTDEEWAGMRRIAETLRFNRGPAPPPPLPPRPERMGAVYFIGADEGPVKIGFTTNVETRLGRLQVGSP